jgi:hypothetical protein
MPFTRRNSERNLPLSLFRLCSELRAKQPTSSRTQELSVLNEELLASLWIFEVPFACSLMTFTCNMRIISSRPVIAQIVLGMPVIAHIIFGMPVIAYVVSAMRQRHAK